nr:uncharacterized protein LOC113825456 [Penaeus vannamei]
MEFIQIVQRPAYSQRPYGVLRSPYIEHPGCSVLCNHPTAPHSHRALLNVTRASWLQEVRAHMARAGTTQVEGDGDTGDRRTPSSMPFTPLGTEGLQVNIPEEFLARFARSDSRPDSPAPTLLVHTSRLAPFRRCVTPDTLEPVRRPRRPVLRRATSLPACLHDLTTTRPQTFPSAPAGRGGGRRKQGRFEADFTTKLSKQLDLVAKGSSSSKQQTQRDQQSNRKGRGERTEEPAQRTGQRRFGSWGREEAGEATPTTRGQEEGRGGRAGRSRPDWGLDGERQPGRVWASVRQRPLLEADVRPLVQVVLGPSEAPRPSLVRPEAIPRKTATLLKTAPNWPSCRRRSGEVLPPT